jgi:hypothetical protein
MQSGKARDKAAKAVGANHTYVSEAVLFSVGANAAHGLRRTNEDKRRAVTVLLTDGEWREWADREIARRCGVDHRFVAHVKSSLGTVPSDERTYTTKHGTVATMQTANIGTKPVEVRPSSEAPRHHLSLVRAI